MTTKQKIDWEIVHILVGEEMAEDGMCPEINQDLWRQRTDEVWRLIQDDPPPPGELEQWLAGSVQLEETP